MEGLEIPHRPNVEDNDRREGSSEDQVRSDFCVVIRQIVI